jgi:hypothetical protein
MPRKTNDVRRKGKDKAREHFEKKGKYDGKSVRRIVAYLEKHPPKIEASLNKFFNV